MPRLVSIYSLSDPITQEVRYIGKTTAPHDRLNHHISNSKRKSSSLDIWIDSLLCQNSKPVIKVIEKVESKIASDREMQTIVDYMKRGFNLLNKAIKNPEVESKYIRHTIFFDNSSMSLYHDFLQWKEQEGITELNQAFRKAIERGIGKSSLENRIEVLEEKVKSLTEALGKIGIVE